MYSWAQKQLEPKSPPPPEDEEGPRYAAFADRMMAAVLDLALFSFLLSAPLQWVSNAVYAGHAPAEYYPENYHDMGGRALFWQLYENGFVTLWTINLLLQMMLIALCLVPFWLQYNSTPAKMLMGMQYADAKSFAPPTRQQYLTRYFSYLFSMPVGLIGFVWLGLNERRQAWHDITARTVVIYSRKENMVMYWVNLIRDLLKKLRETKE